MKIECNDEKTVVLELTRTDMKELAITYDEMCRSTPCAEKAVNTIMEKLSLTPRECKIYAFPDTAGGCMMFFLKEGTTDVSVFEADEACAFLDGAKALRGGEKLHSSLYSLGGSYRLAVRCPDRDKLAVLYEFARYAGGEDAARQTDEYWTLLCRDNALKRLGGEPS